jgi:hypothetical protein
MRADRDVVQPSGRRVHRAAAGVDGALELSGIGQYP